MNRPILLLTTIAVLGNSLSAQSAPTAPRGLPGAWRVVEVTTTGPGASTDTTPEPGLYIFTEKHFSFTRVTGDAPRTTVADDYATVNQLRDILRFAAQAGTYEITGDELVLRRIAALSAANMGAGNSATYGFRLAGDTLWLTSKATQSGPLANPLTVKLVRVE
jgi:hypothetical protein